MFLQRLADISLRYPKLILLLWSLFFVFFGHYATRLPDSLKDHGLMPRGAYVQVEHILASEFHIPQDPIILVFEKKRSAAPAQLERYIQLTLDRMQGVKGLSQVLSPLGRKDMMSGDFAYALLGYRQHMDVHEKQEMLDEIHSHLPIQQDIKVMLTGKPVVQADVNKASQHDLGKAERIGIPAAFIILWLAFGGIVSALIPILVGLIGVGGTMGIMYGLGTKIELSNFVLNVIPMVGLALSIDFALVLVSRFREELQSGSSEQALRTTMMTAGRTVLFSAASVFLGLFGIMFIPLPMFSSIAIGAMTVLTVSVLLSLTFVPALLTLVSPVIQAEQKPLLVAGKYKPLPVAGKHKFSFALFAIALARPIRMLVMAAAVLLLCLLPLAQMNLTTPDATSLPSSYPSREAFDKLQAHISSQESSDVYLLAYSRGAGFRSEDWLHAFSLQQQLEASQGVERVDSIFTTLQTSGLPHRPELLVAYLQKPSAKEAFGPIVQQFVRENKMLLRVRLHGEPSSTDVMRWLRQWEQEGKAAQLPFLLGGEAKYQQEVYDAIFGNLVRVFLFIFVSNYIILFLAFRSLLIPLKTILMNLLSLGASFGILVWIFQKGLLGMEPSSIAIMIPVFIFGLVFGISMDYGVFLVSRIYEVYKQTNDNRLAVWTGLSSVSRLINSAAAIMIAVTLPFAFGEVAGVKQLGVGIAAAIFLDATLIRMIMVPALMVLFGRWNWWVPRWLK